MYQSIFDSVKSLKEDVLYISRLYKDKSAELRSAEVRLDKLANTRDEYLEAVKLAQFSMDSEADGLNNFEQAIEALIQGVFDSGYRFKFEKTYKADKVTVSGIRPVVAYEDGPWRDPLEHGGGMQNTISWGMKFCFIIHNDQIDPMMILDEPFVNLDNLPAVVDFIEKVRAEIPIRIVIVTNMDIGKVGDSVPHYLVVSKSEDTSEVTRVND